MPESRSRRRKVAPTAPPTRAARQQSPRWWVPVMLGLMIVGLLWIVVWYVFENRYPIPGIDVWNLAIGFGLVLLGFLMTTRWR